MADNLFSSFLPDSGFGVWSHALAFVEIMPESSPQRHWAYVGFLALVAVFLALDLGVFHRDSHEVTVREAVAWSAVWVTCGLAFGAFVYFAYEGHWLGLGAGSAAYATDGSVVATDVSGRIAAQQYVTAYVVEKSLAMDNIFVIAVIFGFFGVPAKYQHRVLFWGILGALAMRGAMIFLGAELIQRSSWVLIIFGLFLVVTAVKMALVRGTSDPAMNPIVRLMKRLLPVTDFLDGQKFLTRRTVAPTYSIDPATGKQVQDPPPAHSLRKGWAATPLLLALVMVEVTDLVFAVDSIPAVFAITPDPFIVFTSNIFAILGLRSLYFCLAAMVSRFRYLKAGLVAILAFVGVKLLLMSVPPYLDEIGGWIGQDWAQREAVKISTGLSLGVIAGVLGLSVAASLGRIAGTTPRRP